MQKDVHFYLTYALARRAGLQAREAERIAWADQFVDELVDPGPFGIQTDVHDLVRALDPQIQATVLVPFHFVPGNDPDRPWVVTAGSSRVMELVRLAPRPFSLGIALHALQDSYSHQGFSGWREDLNSCFPWYRPRSAVPNVGHVEMGVIPDVASYVWTDPRSGRVIDNRERALAAAQATLVALNVPLSWNDLVESGLVPIFRLASYDDRKEALRALSGEPGVDYSEISARMREQHLGHFIRAARCHLAAAMGLMP